MKIYNCFLCSLLSAVALLSCSRMNDLHDPYLEKGEIIYTKKVDSAKVFSGENRVLLRYYTTSPNAKKLLVYWNLRTESMLFDIPDKNAEDPVDVHMEDLDEGPVYFELFTLNGDMQNKSVPYNLEGYAYGNIYQQSLVNRGVDAVMRVPGQPVIISWLAADPNATGCLIKYTNQSGATAYQTVPVDEFNTVIPDVSEDVGTIEYQTTYLPDPDAIDVFSSDFTQVSIGDIEERELDKSKFLRWNPPGLPYSGQTNWHIENIWDNTWHPAAGALGYATGGSATDYFTFDMGQTAKLTRFNIRFRHEAALVWWHYMLKKFIVYGSATPDVNADPDTWQYLGTYETVKPSGMPREPTQYTPEDREYAAYTGIDFDMVDVVDAPYVRYIRFQALEIWGIPGWPTGQNTVGIGIQLMELTLWGYPEY
jgi:hypothetical protein